eukprot:CAMPEP_0118978964 /NCGR_PEP_ID=MMETSP1173-20130426/24864_1 /TAXON_ID=1034831 /ORGANISM="Rhizochromulina marina cf, Strain CCMP1243" /LENGTH=327 /DNA_ID=CAMNT_0006929203 /DNA_START=69 /DNA_END=1048 /DNA_ORIENTATION=+
MAPVASSDGDVETVLSRQARTSADPHLPQVDVSFVHKTLGSKRALVEDASSTTGVMTDAAATKKPKTSDGGEDVSDLVGSGDQAAWEGIAPSQLDTPLQESDLGAGEGLAVPENTGRWGSEEHKLFLRGLELYGKGWKKIASLIKTRTVVQIRTHAQKYFQKLAKAQRNNELGGKGCGSAKLQSQMLSSIGRSKHRSGGGSRKRGGANAQLVSPSLRPYLALPGVKGSVQAGLVKFLTPVVVDGRAPVELQEQAAVIKAELIKRATLESNALATACEAISKPPDWYSHGGDIRALLADAESIDWLADSGGSALPVEGMAQQPPLGSP